MPLIFLDFPTSTEINLLQNLPQDREPAQQDWHRQHRSHGHARQYLLGANVVLHRDVENRQSQRKRCGENKNGFDNRDLVRRVGLERPVPDESQGEAGGDDVAEEEEAKGRCLGHEQELVVVSDGGLEEHADGEIRSAEGDIAL